MNTIKLDELVAEQGGREPKQQRTDTPPVEGALALAVEVSDDDSEPVTREQRRSRRKRAVRARTISVKRMTKRELELGRMLFPETEYEKPKTRAECHEGMRPCPFVSCKYHLYLDVQPRTGAIKLNFPDLEVEDMHESCSLDIADRGGTTLEEVGAIMNLTRERIRQLEVRAMAKVKALQEMESLRDFVDEGPVGKRRLPVLVDRTDAEAEDEEFEAEGDDAVAAEPADDDSFELSADLSLPSGSATPARCFLRERSPRRQPSQARSRALGAPQPSVAAGPCTARRAGVSSCAGVASRAGVASCAALACCSGITGRATPAASRPRSAAGRCRLVRALLFARARVVEERERAGPGAEIVARQRLDELLARGHDALVVLRAVVLVVGDPQANVVGARDHGERTLLLLGAVLERLRVALASLALRDSHPVGNGLERGGHGRRPGGARRA
jgi:hypothetical protein